MIKAGNHTVSDKGFTVVMENIGGVPRQAVVAELPGGISDEALAAFCAGPIEVLAEDGSTTATYTCLLYTSQALGHLGGFPACGGALVQGVGSTGRAELLHDVLETAAGDLGHAVGVRAQNEGGVHVTGGCLGGDEMCIRDRPCTPWSCRSRIECNRPP